MEDFVIISIETHLFFARIMKEHALFLEAGFPCKETEWIERAENFRRQFEEVLEEAVQTGNGLVGRRILESGELVTEFTIPAEERTEKLTGIPICRELSEAEHKLRCRERGTGKDQETGTGNLRPVSGSRPGAGNFRPISGSRPGTGNFRSASGGRVSQRLFRRVQQMNERAIRLLNGLISFKEAILREGKAGCLFNANYPLLIAHILREARWYRSILLELRRNRRVSMEVLRGQEAFWNQIMMEHALFIRGLLDPSEAELIGTADGFAADYARLLEAAGAQECHALELREESLQETLKYREFKTAGTEGILKCEIASLILPLLADHVLREASHYIRILEEGSPERM